MHKRLITLFVTILIILASSSLYGDSFVLPEVVDQPMDISSSMEMCRFKASEKIPVSPADIKKEWIKVGKRGVSLGYSDDTLMFRFRFTSKGKSSRHLLFELNSSTLDAVTLYMPDGKGGFSRMFNGDMTPFRERKIADRNPIFAITILPGENEGFLCVQSTSTLKFHFFLYSMQVFIEDRARFLPLFWLLFGWILLLTVINLFLFFSVRESIFLYFVFFALCLFCYQFTVRGFSFQYLWPEATWWNWRAVPFFIAIVDVSIALFTQAFLDTKKKYPRIHQLLSYLCVLPGGIIAALSFHGSIRFLLQGGIFIYFIFNFLGIAAMVTGLFRRDRAALFFTSGMLILFITMPFTILAALGYLSQTPFNMYGRDAAITFFSLMLSLGMGDRINAMKRSLEKSQEIIIGQYGDLQAANRELQSVNEEFEAQNEELVATCADLERSELKFREIAELLPQTIFEMNSIGVLTYVNQHGFEFTGYTREDFRRGLNALDLFVPEDRERIIRRMSELANNDTVIPGEYTLLKKNGTSSPVLVYSRPVRTNNQLQGYRGILIDLAERKKTEAMMIQTEKMMTIGGMAAGMAHEINNPLGIILQGIQNTRRRFEPERKKNREIAEKLGVDLDNVRIYMEEMDINMYLNGIEKAGSRASKIINNMLSFSRESTRQREKVSVNQLIDEVIELAENDYDLGKQYDFRHLRIDKKYYPNLPDIPVIKTEIEQVLLNIIKNSAQALSKIRNFKDDPCITIKTALKEGKVIINIADNGPGINEEEKRHIFEPFFSTKGAGGTGLGLSVSYFIITNNHGGAISVESEEGQGALFNIELPVSHKK